jgi:cytochrome P450
MQWDKAACPGRGFVRSLDIISWRIFARERPREGGHRMVSDTLPRGPKAHLILGHLPDLRRDALGFLTHCARTYGDVVPLRFGRRRAVLLSSAEAIEHVLVGGVKNFIRSPAYRALRVAMGEGLFISDGAVWRRRRRLVQPSFHRDRVAIAAGAVTACTERLLATWDRAGRRDLQEEMRPLTLRIITTLLVGEELGADTAAFEAALAETVEALTGYFTRLPLPIPAIVPTPARLRLRRAVGEVDRLLAGVIARRRAGDAGHDMLGMLLKARDERGHGLTDREIRDEIVVLALNGHETTALGLAYAFDSLARYPEAMATLTAEVDTLLAGRRPTAADLPRLPYTGAVVLETLRLFPPLCTIGRQAARDCTIAGRPVAKGTILLMSQWVVQRDPRYFDEPERFRPERWAGDLAGRLPRFAYFPFGAGQRRCIGDTLAMLEMTLVLAMAAQRFRFEAPSERHVAVDQLGTLRPRGGVPLLVRPRA